MPQASALHFLRGALFALQNAPEPGPWTGTKKGTAPQSYVLYFLFLPPISVAAMSTSPHKSILCPISANHFILHAQVAAISTSPLPNTSLLNDSQHTAGKRPSLPSRCPFSPPKRPEQRRKRTPYVFNSLLLPPIEVAAMSTSPHASTLCPMLPNHFILHAKSLARLALRAPPNPEAGFRFLPSQVYIHIYIYISSILRAGKPLSSFFFGGQSLVKRVSLEALEVGKTHH